MAEMSVEVCSHHFVIRHVTPRAKPAIESFAKYYVQYGLVREHGRWFRAPLRVYAASTARRDEYRFHINTLERFKEHILMTDYGLKGDLVQWIERPKFTAICAAIQVLDKWTLRDYQIPVVDYLVTPPPPVSKLVTLQTGAGKSLIAMISAARVNERLMIIVRPSYIEKWILDIKKTYVQETEEDIMVVQGSAQLQALLELQAQGALDKTKVIIISNKTFQNWIKLYEQEGSAILEQGYACLPGDFCEFLKIGVRLIDEVHQDFHLNFKIDLYTHVEQSFSLSATLISEDDFVNTMYEIAYPHKDRFKGLAYDKYIDARAVIYSIRDMTRVKTSEYGSKTYSHHAFEKSILRSQALTASYFDMIRKIINWSYLKDYEPGQRMLIYGASIDFCTKLVDYLRMQYPTLTINRYVEQDPFDNILESDLCVSTMQSAGTGIDIHNLTTVLLTVAVKSSAANIQGFGRLRKLQDGTVPKFLYMVCQDIQKHKSYHEAKKQLLLDRALLYKEELFGAPI